MTLFSDNRPIEQSTEYDGALQSIMPERMGDGVCNVAGCSCTGYSKGDEPGRCGCGHMAHDHI